MERHRICPCDAREAETLGLLAAAGQSLGENHPACTWPGPGAFLPLMDQSIPPESGQNPHGRFAAVLTGEISVLLKYLPCVSVSCRAGHCAAASPKIHPLLQLWFLAHGLFPPCFLLARDNFSPALVPVLFLYFILDERRRTPLQRSGLLPVGLMLRPSGLAGLLWHLWTRNPLLACL